MTTHTITIQVDSELATLGFGGAVEEECAPESVVVEHCAARPPIEPWLHQMDAEQTAVIHHGLGPLYVAAQAGSGKTRALVHRIARLVAEGTPPAQILAVTFSKKAADEMNTRLAALGVADARVGTWHSLALQIIREDCLPQKSWQVDEKDRHRYLVKEAVGYKHLDWRGADVTKIRSFIGIAKAHLWGYRDLEAVAEARARFGLHATLALQAWQLADELTRQAGLLTFDDMLVFAAQHLASEEAARLWSAKWRYVLQDETQDTNPVQMSFAHALARYHRNYMVVGDPAQSIYGFRGSSPRHFVGFPDEWADAVAVYMCRNYRSGRRIVEAANRVLASAQTKLPVEMVAMRDHEGSARGVVAETLDDEAAQFTAWVLEHQADGGSLADCTALFRTNAQSRALEEALLGAKVPYLVVGGTSFYERREVKDLLAYLRVAAARDKDDDDAVKRSINAPFRFLGARFVDRVMALAECGRRDWLRVVDEAARQAGIQRRQQASADEWCRIVAELEQDVAAGGKPGDLLQRLVDRTGYIAWLQKEEGEESIETSHAANVRELVRVAGRFASVAELLDYIEESIAGAALARGKEQGDRVLLMSIHRSKGLEWPRVWVCGCCEGILPHAKGDPEEERRLFYVAITRARDAVVCSWVRRMAVAAGLREQQPSRFLADAGLFNDSAV